MFCYQKGLKSFIDPLNHSLEKYSHNLTEMAPPTGDKSLSNNPFQISPDHLLLNVKSMTKGHISLHLWGHLRHEAVFSIFTMCNRRAVICFSISSLTCHMLIAKKMGQQQSQTGDSKMELGQWRSQTSESFPSCVCGPVCRNIFTCTNANSLAGYAKGR